MTDNQPWDRILNKLDAIQSEVHGMKVQLALLEQAQEQQKGLESGVSHDQLKQAMNSLQSQLATISEELRGDSVLKMEMVQGKLNKKVEIVRGEIHQMKASLLTTLITTAGVSITLLSLIFGVLLRYLAL
ncbi:hypothetical protein [Marininema halotolerans]|uniref:Uncharacterized protein n=1 Tax=Marininema halotolerans TaxID=1155944 RepID=A0A1I6P4S3_9BACL|nr:hypothetical protein [Marininema halotolerans]SFS35213.1 hypothetical protein SAMN05444972_101360 [Marininema halotolerans]